MWVKEFFRIFMVLFEESYVVIVRGRGFCNEVVLDIRVFVCECRVEFCLSFNFFLFRVGWGFFKLVDFMFV